MRFLSFPILERHVPESESIFTQALEWLTAELAGGRNLVLNCRQGIGRTGLVAASLLLTERFDADAAVRQISTARGIPVPETPEQRRWLDRYATQLQSASGSQT